MRTGNGWVDIKKKRYLGLLSESDLHRYQIEVDMGWSYVFSGLDCFFLFFISFTFIYIFI